MSGKKSNYVERTQLSGVKLKIFNFFKVFFLFGFSFTNIHDLHDSRGKGRLSL